MVAVLTKNRRFFSEFAPEWPAGNQGRRFVLFWGTTRMMLFLWSILSPDERTVWPVDRRFKC
jgi:hypothetical protein